MKKGRCMNAPARFQMASIMPVPQQADSKVLELCFAKGYSLQHCLQLSAISTFSDPARDE